MIENPFFHRGPIHDPAHFHGRGRECKQALEMLSKRQSVSLIGPRKIGKTSLLLYLSRREVLEQHELNPDHNLLVYFNCEGLGELKLADLYALMLEEIAGPVTQLGRHLAIPERPISYLDFRGALRGLSDSDEKLGVVLLLDEFDSLSKKDNLREELFPGLRALAQEHIIAYLTVSQRPLAHSSEEYSPFFNIFIPLKLGLFEETESQGLIEHYLAKAETTFSPEALGYILELGGGHPFFLQVVGHWALELQSAKEAPLESADFRILRRTVRSQVESHFEYYWKHLAPPERYVLTALPLTHGEEIHHEELTSLADLCLIVGENRQYRYFSPLFRDFVRRQEAPDILQVDPFVLVLPIRRVLLREKPLPLSARLFDLLSYLVKHQDQAVSNEELDREVLTPPEEREEYEYVDSERVKFAVRELRRALEDEADCIANVRGVGYMLRIPSEE
jgi:DNA-binding winged helix-turn-helix (wHTH) protein